MGASELAAGDPKLGADSGLPRAREAIESFEPREPAQAEARRRMLAFLEEHPVDAHERRCAPGHLTASAWIVSRGDGRALLGLHRKLGRWLQLGGHCDGDANLAAVALREAREESGIEGLAVEPPVIDLDVHPIPARPGEPEHLHLDARFLVWAPADAKEQVSEESHALRWCSPTEAESLELDDSVRRLARVGWAAARESAERSGSGDHDSPRPEDTGRSNS